MDEFTGGLLKVDVIVKGLHNPVMGEISGLDNNPAGGVVALA